MRIESHNGHFFVITKLRPLSYVPEGIPFDSKHISLGYTNEQAAER